MNKKPMKTDRERAAFVSLIRAKSLFKIKARRQVTPGIWFGFGMMGIIGWSISVPALLGVALGFWLDQRYTEGHSWTLALLVAGLSIGCVNAWKWVAKEERAMRNEHASEDQHNE